MQIDLRGQIVFLTGATSGIGVSAAHLLSQAGAAVAIHYNTNEREAKALQKKTGNYSKIFQADLSNTNEAEKCFEEVISNYGKLDTLINNAGVYLRSPLDKQTTEWLESWHRTLTINLTSAGLLCKLAIPVFKRQGGGRIINIASRAAFRGDTDEYLAYAASKGGLVSLTRTIARAYGKNNIKAFIVAPGFVKTKMAKEFIQIHGEKSIIDELSLKKLTEPEDVAPAIVFLASGMMDHVTGNTIDINAGSYIR